jgi:hypothetical protein
MAILQEYTNKWHTIQSLIFLKLIGGFILGKLLSNTSTELKKMKRSTHVPPLPGV